MENQEPLSRKIYTCIICQTEERVIVPLNENDFLSEHLKEVHNIDYSEIRRNHSRRKQCNICQRHYRYAHHHFIKFHTKIKHLCLLCHNGDTIMESRRAILEHARERHDTPNITRFYQTESAFNRLIRTFTRDFPRMSKLSLDEAFTATREDIYRLLKRQLALWYRLRFAIILFVQYRKVDDLGQTQDTLVLPLRVKFQEIDMITSSRRLKNMLSDIEEELQLRSDQIEVSGSGWSIDFVCAENIELARIVL